MGPQAHSCSVWRLSMLLGHSRPQVFKVSPPKAAHIISDLVSWWRTNMQQWQPAWTQISGQRFWFWSIWLAFHGWSVGRVPCGIRYDHDLCRQVYSYHMCPHRKFDRKYELEAACANYGDENPPWPPGPRVLARLPDQHAITPPKNKPFFICTYTGVYVSFLYIFIFWLCSWTIKCLSPVGHTHSALNLTLNKNSPGSTQHVTSENPYLRACALCSMRSANAFHNLWAHDHIWENSILFVLGGDMSKHVIDVWLMCSERMMNVWLMHD